MIAINDLLSMSGGKGERLYFFYAGHGLTARVDNRDENALVASDFNAVNTDNSIALRSLWEFFETTQFRDQFFFVDACRNIPWENREFEIGRWTLPRARDPGLDPVQQFILYATSPGLTAAESGEFGNEHGAFTGALLDGLAGTDFAKAWSWERSCYEVRWERLADYVKQKLESEKHPADGASGDAADPGPAGRREPGRRRARSRPRRRLVSRGALRQGRARGRAGARRRVRDRTGARARRHRRHRPGRRGEDRRPSRALRARPEDVRAASRRRGLRGGADRAAGRAVRERQAEDLAADSQRVGRGRARRAGTGRRRRADSRRAGVVRRGSTPAAGREAATGPCRRRGCGPACVRRGARQHGSRRGGGAPPARPGPRPRLLPASRSSHRGRSGNRCRSRLRPAKERRRRRSRRPRFRRMSDRWRRLRERRSVATASSLSTARS